MQIDENKNYLELKKKKRKFLQFDLATEAIKPDRSKKFTFSFHDLTLDISRQRIPTNYLNEFLNIAKSKEIKDSIKKLFEGTFYNNSEKVNVTHFIHRNPENFSRTRNQRYIDFETKLKSKSIKRLINVGIGGSDLGSKMVYQALNTKNNLPDLINVSNIDPQAVHNALTGVSPREVFFIFNSKSFATEEILANLILIKDWLKKNKIDFSEHACAVTSYPGKAIRCGFEEANIFVVDKGVGGRFSLWSDFGLGLVGSLGTKVYRELLLGGHSMDVHFLKEDLNNNLPYVLGLTRIWNRNILDLPNLGIIPYGEGLKFFNPWVQQVEMESNGKNVDTQGIQIRTPTSPIIFGSVGTDAQHSFFQALHQGVEIIPIEILVPVTSNISNDDISGNILAQNKLAINALAQCEALMLGDIGSEDRFRIFKGGRPSTLISWETTDALSLGRLISLYENASIVSGLVWGINSFDQLGVELGKEIAKNISNGKNLTKLSSAGKEFFKKL